MVQNVLFIRVIFTETKKKKSFAYFFGDGQYVVMSNFEMAINESK